MYGAECDIFDPAAALVRRILSPVAATGSCSVVPIFIAFVTEIPPLKTAEPVSSVASESDVLVQLTIPEAETERPLAVPFGYKVNPELPPMKEFAEITLPPVTLRSHPTLTRFAVPAVVPLLVTSSSFTASDALLYTCKRGVDAATLVVL